MHVGVFATTEVCTTWCLGVHEAVGRTSMDFVAGALRVPQARPHGSPKP